MISQFNPLILAVHIGHDASASVLRDRKIVGHALRERHSKVRHHLGIDQSTIEIALAQSGLTVKDVDVVAVTATQQIPNIVNDPDWFSFSEQSQNDGLKPFRLNDNPWWEGAENFIVERWRKHNAPEQAKDYIAQLSQYRGIQLATQEDWEMLGILSPLYGPAQWLDPYTLDETSVKVKEFLRLALPQTSIGKLFGFRRKSPQAFHFQLEVSLGGRSVPGYFINHHMAHAASSYYSAPEPKALIFTHDGGTAMDSGFYFLGSENKIVGLGPHHLECGQFYDFAANKLGLGTLGGAGKLMGLAPYGKGLLDDLLPRGTRLDWWRWAGIKNDSASADSYQALFGALVDTARQKGFDTDKIGDPAEILSGAPAEIAHAVQRLLESSISDSISQAADAIRQEGLVEHADHLCISGGVALNCPSNSKLWTTNRFKRIHVEPHCEDGGLSIGAAHYVANHFYGARKKLADLPTSQYAMIGTRSSAAPSTILDHFKGKISWESPESWQHTAASAIANNHVVAVYFGRYETGPRALGHRSILANPTDRDNWEKVNLIKKRELWRPFAPAVLAADMAEWFEEGPPSSPFMLFTHKLRGCQKDKLPAMTHVDGTARVQTVTSADEPLYGILSCLKQMGRPPVVLNTSFNGPGQPIVQDLYDAIEILLESEIEFLFIDGLAIRKVS